MQALDADHQRQSQSHLARKIWRLLSDHRGKKFFKSSELLEENLAAFSQNSFMAKIREHSEDKLEEENIMEVEEETEKRYCKALNHFKQHPFLIFLAHCFESSPMISLKERLKRGDKETILQGGDALQGFQLHSCKDAVNIFDPNYHPITIKLPQKSLP
jgi:hypothetical protein